MKKKPTNTTSSKLAQVKKIVKGFDADFDDPFSCLQEIANCIGLKMRINESED